MPVSFQFVGQGDSSGEWFSSTRHYAGPANKSCPFIGQRDSLGEWFSATSSFVGTAIPSKQWVGQGDTNGYFASSTVQYFGPPYFLTSGVITTRTLVGTGTSVGNLKSGLSFMKSVYTLVRDYWPLSLSTPYSGQIFPTGGNSGGPGQVYPF